MTTSYEAIFSHFLSKATDYSLLELSASDLFDMECEWLYKAVYDQRVRKLFSSISMDNDSQELTFELKNSVDDESDEGFVINLLSHSMVIGWLRPQVDSILHTAPMIGSDKEKRLIDHHSHTIARLSSLEKQLRKMIRDYGYYYNDYVRG